MKLRLKSIARFTRQLATYEDSFVDLRRALESMSKSTVDSRMSASLVRVRERINEGYGLSEAFAQEGDRFPVIFIRMTKIGEESGTLAAIYRHLADYFDQQLSMRRRLYHRLIYPAFMGLAMILVHGVISAVFGSISDAGTDWHSVERIFVRTVLTDFAVIGAAIGAIWILRFLLVGRSVTDAILISVPPLRGAFRKLMLSRFSLSMYLMTGSAIGMPEAVKESGAATGNGYASWVLDKAAERIREGTPLTPVLADTGLFPQDFIDIVSVSEESGTISESMRRVSVHYAEDADMALNRLTSGLAWFVYLSMMGVMAFYIITLFARYVSNITNMSQM